MIIDTEALTNASHRMAQAADRAQAAADRMESAAHQIALLLEDGYGGNGLRLIELLEKLGQQPQPSSIPICSLCTKPLSTIPTVYFNGHPVCGACVATLPWLSKSEQVKP